jgi:Sec-independent protein translocase protein TatA
MFEGLFQPMHLLVVFGIALLVFGPKETLIKFSIFH